jgi:hypothetical protein
MRSCTILNFDMSLVRTEFGKKFDIDRGEGHFRAEFLCKHWEGRMRGMNCNMKFGYQLSIPNLSAM